MPAGAERTGGGLNLRDRGRDPDWRPGAEAELCLLLPALRAAGALPGPRLRLDELGREGDRRLGLPC